MEESLTVELIARAQRGSPEDAGMLYTYYHPGIYRYLFYRTGNPQAAEDLTADVFLKMVQTLPSLRFESLPFQAWLFQVARNLAIDQYRRNSAHPQVSLVEDLPGSSDPSELVEMRLNSASLAEALNKIEETQRDALLLRFIEGFSIADTARILHKSIDAVKALQRRGLQALRILLESEKKVHE